MYLRYSSSVVAPMHWISPRERAGLRTLLASIAPSAPPAPTSVCSSSMKRIVFFARRTSFITALIRSSNWPRYLVPATIIARSNTTIRRSTSNSGTLPFDHALGKPLDDRRLADAGFAQQHRIVLCPAAQDLHGPLDFLLAADHRVELSLPGQLGQVAAETVQGGGLRLAGPRRLAGRRRRRRRRPPPARSEASAPSIPWPNRFRTSSRTSSSLSPQVHQHLRGYALLLAEQAQQDVLGADVVVVEVSRSPIKQPNSRNRQ